MKHVIRSILVPYSAEQMYALVNDVPRYPEFLPWCGGARILEQTESRMRAEVEIVFRGLRQSFTTDNTLYPNERIELHLVRGPFKRLSGEWRFKPIGEVGCRVEFELIYAFDGLLAHLIAPVFDKIAATFVDAFVARADQLYAR
ncbi:MAG: type II toxin-antitoxin system RatA family toxin [Casimicrobiaceae bacterium]|nr:type II toxin-antitoxin system RatA family toxin [Casimicrobiaceae bacterium]MCX8098022.1 type II toxin-antitoxin system RatA family toxin [Casimicrobiaceae bacterium]MDW8312450.1 type II toxin-antitoxin system RatA family toxin [Burkholderiales bacterium]